MAVYPFGVRTVAIERKLLVQHHAKRTGIDGKLEKRNRCLPPTIAQHHARIVCEPIYGTYTDDAKVSLEDEENDVEGDKKKNEENAEENGFAMFPRLRQNPALRRPCGSTLSGTSFLLLEPTIVSRMGSTPA